VPKEIGVRVYARSDGAEPYTAWETGLRDRKARAKIRARIGRLRLGNFGDSKRVGEVFELRIHVGPGYRVYYGREGNTIVILLCGGDKPIAGEGHRARRGLLARLSESGT